MDHGVVWVIARVVRVLELALVGRAVWQGVWFNSRCTVSHLVGVAEPNARVVCRQGHATDSMH